MSQEYWEGVARDTYSILNSQGDNHCRNILSLSYNHLPAHLKPCFLYMSVFAEDEEIIVSRLIQRWVAEGFLRPDDSQTLEEVAIGYLKDLVGRNLILVNRWGSNGKMRACNIHDLIRELCLSMAEKEKCLWARNVSCGSAFLKDDLRRVNMRFLEHRYFSSRSILKRIYLLWNLQTVRIQMLRIQGYDEQIIAPSQIWEMIQLRHIKVHGLCLPDPPQNDGAGLLLPNLQTLCKVNNFRLNEEVCKIISNVKKLGLKYTRQPHSQRSDASSSYYYPENVGRFHKLESLKLEFEGYWRPMVLNMKFPSSLKKLTLFGGRLHWEDLEMIGSLPNLEVLKLRRYAVIGSEWNPVEGQFQHLKFLEIRCYNLIRWNADETHFPVLEKLVLRFMWVLDEIPSGIGDIPTLRTIHVVYCSLHCCLSVVKILEEQEGLGNEDLKVKVEGHYKLVKEYGFTSKNLRII